MPGWGISTWHNSNHRIKAIFQSCLSLKENTGSYCLSFIDASGCGALKLLHPAQRNYQYKEGKFWKRAKAKPQVAVLTILSLTLLGNRSILLYIRLMWIKGFCYLRLSDILTTFPFLTQKIFISFSHNMFSKFGWVQNLRFKSSSLKTSKSSAE